MVITGCRSMTSHGPADGALGLIGAGWTVSSVNGSPRHHELQSGKVCSVEDFGFNLAN